MANLNEFTLENFKSYAHVCSEIALDMPDKDFDTLLLPSRGAMPVFMGALYALDKIEDPKAEDFLNRLHAPKLIQDYAKIKGITTGKKENEINVLLCPFTADLNMEQYREDVESSKFVDEMRDYWAEVISGFTKGKKERKKNQQLQFYLNLLENVENRKELAEEYGNYPRVEKIAMIDTVISGRASSTILKSFKKREIEPYSFLVVDKNGERLKYPYSNDLLQAQNIGMAKKYNMNRLLTEDEGAHLEGIVAAVYPSLMFKGSNSISETEEFYPVGFKPFGAGSWHLPKEGSDCKRTYELFLNTLKKSVEDCWESSSKTRSEMQESIDSLCIKLKEHAKNPEHETSESLNYVKQHANKIYVTGSGVVHICFSDNYNHAIIEGSKNYKQNNANKNL